MLRASGMKGYKIQGSNAALNHLREPVILKLRFELFYSYGDVIPVDGQVLGRERQYPYGGLLPTLRRVGPV